ncbi:conjugal transfer protein TraO, partial [Escherichia coli]|nr:conjugal transfer protein TraO [Escherichia coli]
MSAEQDAGKSGKKLAALLGLSSIILFGGSYIAFSKLSGSNSDMQSAVNINSAASGGTRSVTETPHYRELLRADNERGAAAAARNNQTFIASLPQGLDIPDTPEKQQQPAAKPENYAYRQASGTPEEDRAASEKRMERLQKLIVRIKDQHPAGSTPTIATTMWNKSPAE